MVFEINSNGQEFFIVLEGKVDVYKAIANEEEARKITDAIRKEKVVPYYSPEKPSRSNFPGIPKKIEPKKTELLHTENGFYVIYNGITN